MTEHQKQLFREGIVLFNRGQYFECHEVLEELWLQTSGTFKRFLQGLIQAAVALHHLGRGNLQGARRLLDAAIEKIASDAPETPPIDALALLASLEPIRQELRLGQVPSPAPKPQIIPSSNL